MPSSNIHIICQCTDQGVLALTWRVCAEGGVVLGRWTQQSRARRCPAPVRKEGATWTLKCSTPGGLNICRHDVHTCCVWMTSARSTSAARTPSITISCMSSSGGIPPTEPGTPPIDEPYLLESAVPGGLPREAGVRTRSESAVPGIAPHPRGVRMMPEPPGLMPTFLRPVFMGVAFCLTGVASVCDCTIATKRCPLTLCPPPKKLSIELSIASWEM